MKKQKKSALLTMVLVLIKAKTQIAQLIKIVRIQMKTRLKVFNERGGVGDTEFVFENLRNNCLPSNQIV